MNYRRIVKIFIVFSLFSMVFSSCRDDKTGEEKVALTDDQLVDINRELVIKERERIESYIKRKDLNMVMSDAGIWISLIKEGQGQLLEAGDKVSLEYTCSLLDGTLCYSSARDGELKISIGRSDIATGLDEALRMLKPGAEAVIILPSNMAYGLIGDNNRIPARAALIYRIKVSPV